MPMRSIAVALTLALATPGAAQSTAIAVTAASVPLDGRDPERVQNGALRYLGGFELTSPDRRFGGISGFELTADASRLVGVSDRGYWIVIDLLHDPAGRLLGVETATVHPLLSGDGDPLSGRLGDAEDVARLPGGGWLVSFEHEHRVAIFAQPGAREQPGPKPGGLETSPPNGGIEAMAALPDGTIVALGEKPTRASGTFRGWVLAAAGETSRTLTYATVDGFQPTGLSPLANGDLIALERRFSLLTGVAARLVRIPASALSGADGPIRTTELARFGGTIVCDNFEAVAVRDLPGGGAAIYIGSDDNYSSNQRTLLLQLQKPQGP